MRREDELIIDLSRPIIEEDRIRSLINQNQDWDYVLKAASRNRLDGILFNTLDKLGLFEKLPRQIQAGFENRYHRTVVNTRVYLETAGRLAKIFKQQNIDLIVLRGLALGLTVYEKPYLRPFSDLDLLFRKREIEAAKKIFERNGFTSLPGLLPPRYFKKYHLHLTLQEPSRGLLAELHWALDHPYTLYTVDYDALFQGKREAAFSGIKLPVLQPEDRLLTLCLHLVKHCPFLRPLSREKYFPAILLRGKLAFWLHDIGETLSHPKEDFDWSSIERKTREWNLEEQVSICLEAVEKLYHLPRPHPWKPPRRDRLHYLEKKIYGMQLSFLRGKDKPGRAARFLFGLRADTIFRPVRLLDLKKYILPTADYIRKRYQVSGPLIIVVYAGHIIRALGRLICNLTEFCYHRFRT